MISSRMLVRASAQARDDALGEEPHGGEHPLVRDAPTDVHPDGQRRVAERLAKSVKTLGDRIGRAVYDQLLEDLVVAHAAEPGGFLASRASLAELLRDGAEEMHRAGLGLLARPALGVGDVDGYDERHL